MSLRRTVFAAAIIAVAGVGLCSPSVAQDVDVNLYVGPPVGFWPGWAPGRRFITCREGRRLVARPWL